MSPHDRCSLGLGLWPSIVGHGPRPSIICTWTVRAFGTIARLHQPCLLNKAAADRRVLASRAPGGRALRGVRAAAPAPPLLIFHPSAALVLPLFLTSSSDSYTALRLSKLIYSTTQITAPCCLSNMFATKAAPIARSSTVTHALPAGSVSRRSVAGGALLGVLLIAGAPQVPQRAQSSKPPGSSVLCRCSQDYRADLGCPASRLTPASCAAPPPDAASPGLRRPEAAGGHGRGQGWQ